MGKNSLFNKWYYMMKTVQLYAKESNWPTVTPCTKINSKFKME